MSSRPFSRASHKGGSPLSLTTDMSAPRVQIASTTSGRWLLMASWSAVCPSWVLVMVERVTVTKKVIAAHSSYAAALQSQTHKPGTCWEVNVLGKCFNYNTRLPNIDVCLMLEKEESTLAVLSLDGHVKQRLSVGHGVIDRRPWAQQLSSYGVHTYQGEIDHQHEDSQPTLKRQRCRIKGVCACAVAHLSRGPSPALSGPWCL